MTSRGSVLLKQPVDSTTRAPRAAAPGACGRAPWFRHGSDVRPTRVRHKSSTRPTRIRHGSDAGSDAGSDPPLSFRSATQRRPLGAARATVAWKTETFHVKRRMAKRCTGRVPPESAPKLASRLFHVKHPRARRRSPAARLARQSLAPPPGAWTSTAPASAARPRTARQLRAPTLCAMPLRSVSRETLRRGYGVVGRNTMEIMCITLWKVSDAHVGWE